MPSKPSRVAFGVQPPVIVRPDSSNLGRRLPDYHDAGLELRTHRDTERIVRVRPAVSPADAYRHNRDLVVDVADAARVGYFAVSSPTARHVIGVRSRDWKVFVAALLAAGGRQPLYVGVDAADERNRVRRWSTLVDDPVIGEALLTQPELEVFEILGDSFGSFLDRPYGCVVQRWSEDQDGRISTHRRNSVTQVVDREHQAAVRVPDDGRLVTTIEPFAHRGMIEVDFPIDVVYTWVDSSDPLWSTSMSAARKDHQPRAERHDSARFRDNGELRFSLRSLELYAPWVRHIYLVTDRQCPTWLDRSDPRVTVVDHTEIFKDCSDVLPVFNSHAIGSRLHHIEGLSEHYLHFNDDFFLARPTTPGQFFLGNGTSKFFLSKSTLSWVTPDHRAPHEAARWNVADLLEADFGRRPTRGFYHTPITQQRGLMYELEQRYPEQFAATSGSRFRSSDDLETNSWLHHYYGYLQGRSIPADIRYDYFDVSNSRDLKRMESLGHVRGLDCFCINDHEDIAPHEQLRARRFLESVFPRPSRFETDVGAQAAPVAQLTPTEVAG